MKIGVNIDALPDLPQPSEIPAQVARFQAIDGPPFYYTGVYASMLKEAGKEGLARMPWIVTTDWPADWVDVWARHVDTKWAEYGNEPAPANWYHYRTCLRIASPILREQGRKVILAAARTNRTTEWLSTTPDSVWEAVDGVALHPYAKDAGEVVVNVLSARRLVPDHLPLYATEFGWAVDTSPEWADHPLTVATKHAQAMKIQSTLKLLAWQTDLKLASVFMHKDFGPECDRWWRHAGLIKENGKHRPAFDVVAEASK